MTDLLREAQRTIFCNRTLNLRPIRAIGYDMDYTLIHYHVEEWERRAFQRARDKLVSDGWPIEEAIFDPSQVIRGLVIDRELGNLVKSNRFGYVKAAAHGSRMLSFDEVRRTYAREVVDLSESRYVFLNTLFGLSEASLYMQLVDALDAGRLAHKALHYGDLYEAVRQRVDQTHIEGALKAEIVADPDRFVVMDPEVPLTLLDQKESGKKVLLITNSGWPYTRSIMTYAFDRHLPKGMTWRDLFELVIVSARKPNFFAGRCPVLEVKTEEGLLQPWNGTLEVGGAYVGGDAGLVEESLGLSGEQILYVGDHVYGDVQVSKSIRRWRTALVVRELEDELEALHGFADSQAELSRLMREKADLESELSQVRLELMRVKAGYGGEGRETIAVKEGRLASGRAQVQALDETIGPLAKASSEMANPSWGLLMRAGNDKSYMARQVERHADVYTSRVSNFLHATPFAYLRSSRGTLPHDPG